MIKQTAIIIMTLCCFALQTAHADGLYSYREPTMPASQDARYRELFHKSVYLGMYQFLTVYGLTKLPESLTKWSPEQRRFRNFGRNWVKHVRSSPVFDKDPMAVNYIGHPWGGAGYYVMARQTGLTSKEAFVYTLIESTFAWEYGFEAMVERPSVQDLFITPAIGTIMGELKYRKIQEIQANDGMLWGSHTYGSIAIVLLSPYNALVEATRALFHDTDKKPDVYTDFTITQHGSTKPYQRILFHFNLAI